MASTAGAFLPEFVRKKVLNSIMRPFADPKESVREDVALLRKAPLMPKEIPIYGLVRGGGGRAEAGGVGVGGL